MPEKNRWPAAKASVMDECKPKLKTLEFDPMGIDEDDLLNLALEIFLEIGVHQGLGIETEKIQGFLLGVRDRMLENPFHNWAHVFDVTQVPLSPPPPFSLSLSLSLFLSLSLILPVSSLSLSLSLPLSLSLSFALLLSSYVSLLRSLSELFSKPPLTLFFSCSLSLSLLCAVEDPVAGAQMDASVQVE